MPIEILLPRCVSSGMCALTAPEVFDQDDDLGRVVLLRRDPGPDLADAVRDAAASCPAQAIRLHDPAPAAQPPGVSPA
ncbi:ferredoxin [Micromonospora sp. NPDC048898]|uniref:ferredoxin n=1 Tax=Micromonospora sp. NPDC048898 TaxID=3364260 RepID=UPI003721B087